MSRKFSRSIPNEVIGFPNDLTLPVPLWSWDRLSLQHKLVPGILLGVMSGRHVRMTNLPPLVSRLYRNCGNLDVSQPHGPPWVC
jgi:hypothetical protein